MKFFTNFKVKKTKKDYETLLEFKDDLDSVSLKVSILNDRIINFKKTSSLSFDKMNDYINKIHASAKKNNISLCKKGFFKYCRENLIYNSILEHSEVISKEFLSVSDSLSNLQDIYLILESEFNQSINSSKISLKPFFSSSIKDFKELLSTLETLISNLQQKLKKNFNAPNSIDDSTMFKTTIEFENAFYAFIKEKGIHF